MFREMRRSDRELGGEDILNILADGEYGILSTTGENGYAYGIPVSYAYADDCIYFHCAQEGQKLDNIKYNDRVCFTVTGRTQVLPEKFSTIYESAVVFGKASIIDGEEKMKAFKAILRKYSPDFVDAGIDYAKSAFNKACVVRINVERVTGKGRRA